MEHAKQKVEIDNSLWFKHWFDSPFYHQLYANRDEREATSFIDEMVNELNPKSGASVLDLGCGSGRHSKRLASKGFQVTGLDLSASSIRMAQRSIEQVNNSRAERSSMNFYRHDMRVAFGKNRFDYVFNLFTSFGYFKTNLENYQVVNNIADSLVKGGILVMDYLNVQFAEKTLVPTGRKEIDGIIYHIERWTDARFFFKKVAIDNLQGDPPVEYIEQVAKLSVSDFGCMFMKYGLRIQQIFGDYYLNDFDVETSPRLIMIASR
jgi:SAM-dependent methyltransferase